MITRFLKRMAPVAVLAIGSGLAGCNTSIDMSINGEEGVPLAELDMAGAPPDELVVTSGDTVIISEGDTLDISVEGDDEAVAQLRFVRDGDLLGITREEGSWEDSGKAVVRVTMAAPRELLIGGSGSIEAASIANEAEITIGGAGSVKVAKVDAAALELAIGGTGEVKAAGKAKKLEIAIGGSGTVDFSELKADDAEISIGGSGDVKLQSDGTVEANIGGSGDIYVTGTAKCTLNSFGSGNLECKPAGSDAAAEPATAESAAKEQPKPDEASET